MRCCLQEWARCAAQVGCGPSTLDVLCLLELRSSHRLVLAFLGWGDPRASAGGREQGSRHPGGYSSQTPGSSREPWRAPGLLSCATPACLPSWTWSPGVGALSPSSCPPRPCPPPHYLSLSASCLFPRYLSRLPALSAPAPQPPGPGHRPSPRPRPRVSLCHWLLPAPVSPPLVRPGLPRFLAVPPRRLREGTAGGVAAPLPHRRRPGLGGGPAPGAPAYPLGTGPRGARPDGLHGELGVLRGAGARAPLRPPTPGEPPGPGAGPVLGARGFGPRREQAAPASGRHCGDGWGEWWWAEPSSPETGKEPSQVRARQLSGGGQ